MSNLLITYLQVFGIGFSFGLAGPCFLTCAPVLITYIAGSPAEVFKKISIFLSGRLLAYVLLGALAGLSGAALKIFTGSSLSSYIQPLAGAVTILFAVILLTGKSGVSCAKVPTVRGKTLDFGGIFAFGLLVGLSPCAPLLALLFDIALMSKGVFDGMLYALSFGLGTFVSGFITVGVIAGVLTRIPAAFVKSKSVAVIFKIVCAVLLLILGLGLISRAPLRVHYHCG